MGRWSMLYRLDRQGAAVAVFTGARNQSRTISTPKGAVFQWARARTGLLVVLTLYCVLAGAYSVIVPPLEVPDEMGHLEYSFYMATSRQRPPLPSGIFEAHQAPLYYALLAPIPFALGFNTPTEFYLYPDLVSRPVNPDGAFHGGSDARLFIHTEADAFPYQGYALAVHLMRFVSVLMGAGVVIVAYQLSLLLFHLDRPRAALTAAVASFVPYFNLLSGAVTNDALANLIGALLILLIARLIVISSSSWRSYFVLGLFCGVALLTKESLFGIMLFVCVPLIYLAKSPRRFVFNGLAVVVATLLVGGWYVVSNIASFGEPIPASVQRAHLTALGQVSEEHLSTLGQWWGYFSNFLLFFHDSFWGNFGIYNVPLPRVVYRAYDVLVGASGLGLLLTLWRWRPRAGWSRQKTALVALGLMVPVQFAAIVYRDQTYWAPQGRYLYVVLPVIALYLATGVLALAPSSKRRVLSGCVSCLLAGVAIWVPFGFLGPVYATPQAMPAGSVPVRINDERMPILAKPASHGQSFTVTRGNLSGIEVKFGTFGGKSKAPVTLYLRETPASTTDIASATLDAATLPENQFALFSFPPIADSAGRTYYFVLDVPEDTQVLAPAVHTSYLPVEGAVQRYVNGRKEAGSVEFRLRFQPR